MEQTAVKKPPVVEVENNGFKFKALMSADLMIAHLYIEQIDQERIWDVSTQELSDFLKNAGIVYGIKEDVLEKLLTEPVFNRNIEIARGNAPGKGIDSESEMLFELAGDKAPVVGDDGYIDYKNLSLINNAVAGQPLAKKIPATVGPPGVTVTGQEIPGKMGKDKALPKGANTVVSEENPDLLIAAKDGAITFSNNLVSIDNVYKINSDVDTATGNIDFVGSLQITGEVKAGFQVKAAGNIEIGKNIEDAQIISGGSVVAKGGFVGSGKGLIKATEDVFVKYVENQEIIAGNDVNVGGEAMNSKIVAKNAVILKGQKAVIVGGIVSAGKLIEASIIGSQFGTPTIVRAGFNTELMDELNKIETEINRLDSDNERIKKALYTLVRLELDNKLGAAQKAAMKQLKDQQVEIPNHIEQLQKHRKELIAKISENKKAKIEVKNMTYPGTIIQIGMLKREINKMIGHCTFGVSNDKIVIMSHS
jgi:uncharacterized protein (DUF342 family)